MSESVVDDIDSSLSQTLQPTESESFHWPETMLNDWLFLFPQNYTQGEYNLLLSTQGEEEFFLFIKFHRSWKHDLEVNEALIIMKS